jgi:hypothetical protein
MHRLAVKPLGGAGHAGLETPAAFDWASLAAPLRDRDYYLVVFRSHRRPGADSRGLWREDKLAFAEAIASGGLLHYHQGLLDRRRRSISFCLWENEEQAAAAVRLPTHRLASTLAAGAYSSYVIERWGLRKSAVGVALELLGTRQAAPSPAA